MNYYDKNKKDEYNDSFYIPKKDNKNNKKQKNKNKNKKAYFKNLVKKTLIILFIFIFILGVIFFMTQKNKNKTDKNIKNIEIENHSFSPEFSENIYDYYLLTDDEKITINCNLYDDKEVKGCNETISLENYSNYIHQIIINKSNEKIIYNINIKVKESDKEENIYIESIDGLNGKWTNQNKIITINANCENKIIGYSIDNGITWQQSNTFEISENSQLNIIVKDEYNNQTPVRKESINKIDKTIPKGIIIKEKSSSNKITLKVIAKDEESGIYGYSWDGKKYGNNDELDITEKGTYSVTIKDKSGNVSEKISINIKDSDFNQKKQYSATFYKNGSLDISNDFLSCTITDNKCSITLPTINRDGATILGWSHNKNNQTAEYKPGEKINLTENMTLYAITNKEVIATFHKNNALEISSNIEKCILYNNDNYCYVKVPNIIYNDGKIIGWNTNSEASTVSESPNSIMKVYKDIDYYALVYKNIIVIFNKNGSDNISSTREMCRIGKGLSSCTIITPSITRENSNIIGWSEEKDDISATVLENEEIEVSNNIKLYAITKKDIKINFNNNGADKLTSTQEICSIFNTERSCQIITPKIYRDESEIIGWSNDKNSKEKSISENTLIDVNKNNTYYAITKKNVKLNFYENGADNISTNAISCSYYNNENGCEITTPNIIRSSWKIVGWSNNKNATTAKFGANTKQKVKKSDNYYAITSKKLTATFYKNNADSLAGCSTTTNNGCIETCYLYNLNSSCQVNIPYIYSKGNEVQFFSTSSNSNTTVGYSPAKKLNLLNNIELNAIVDNRYRSETYSIIKNKNYGYTAFETEAGCPTNVYNNYYNFTDRLYQKVPYIFKAAKVTFTSDVSFQKTWGNYSGMTYGTAIGYRNVDIKCTDTYSEYYLHTIVHELVHSWDSYYRSQTGSGLSDYKEFKNLYNKYSTSSKQPLRSYSYTNVSEFVADAYAWYYFLYIDTTIRPTVVKNNTYYPNDLKEVIEKYINYAKKGYK